MKNKGVTYTPTAMRSAVSAFQVGCAHSQTKHSVDPAGGIRQVMVMRKICLLGVTALILTSSPVMAASDAEIVAEQAAKCWVMPDPHNYQTASARFEVTYNAEGELAEIVTVEYQPVRKAGELFALSAQQALIDCASKAHVKSRTLHVVMKYTAPRPGGALIMKKSLR